MFKLLTQSRIFLIKIYCIQFFIYIILPFLLGYFAALVAGLWPSLVKSVVLINTAGSVIPGYSSVQLTEVGQYVLFLTSLRYTFSCSRRNFLLSLVSPFQ